MAVGHLGIDQQGLKRFLQKVNAAFPLDKAILFGSRARGDELMESDYDLLLVSAAFTSLAWTDRMAAVLRYWDLPAGVEVLCYTAEEFTAKAMEIGLAAEAVREGKEITIDVD